MTSALSSFANGFALSATLIIAIGAQNMFVLRQGLQRRHIGPVVAFCAAADALLILLGVTGLGALLDLMPQLSLLLTLGGAAFLGVYGIRALIRSLSPANAMVVAGAAPSNLRTVLMTAAGFALLNPHVYLDTVVLMGAVGSAQPADLRPFFTAGAMLASACWFSALGYGARLLTPLFARPSAWRMLDGIVGLTMLALAAGLLARLV